jgi:hypothetical protein
MTSESKNPKSKTKMTPHKSVLQNANINRSRSRSWVRGPNSEMFLSQKFTSKYQKHRETS